MLAGRASHNPLFQLSRPSRPARPSRCILRYCSLAAAAPSAPPPPPPPRQGNLLRPSRTEYSFQLVAPEDVKNPHHSSAIIPSLCPTGREMMSAQLPSPAEPTGNRFVVVTPDDHSASLIIVAILFLIYSCLLFAVRILVVKRKRHGWDDGILGWAYLVALGQWTSIFIAIHYGLGKSLSIVSIQDQNLMAQTVFAGRILLMPVLCFSKISVLLVIRSLFIWETRRKLLLIDMTILIVAMWGVVSVLILSIDCSPEYILGSENGECANHIARIRVVMISEMITEFCVFMLPLIFLGSFDIALRTKVVVVYAFAFRLPLIALSTLYLLTQTQNPSATGTALVPNIIYQQLLLPYSLMSATIPCLKSFVERFKTSGVSYILDPIAGPIVTLHERSHEMGTVWEKGEGNRSNVEILAERQNAAKRNSGRSARFSRMWKGPREAEAVGMDSQASAVPMIELSIVV